MIKNTSKKYVFQGTFRAPITFCIGILVFLIACQSEPKETKTPSGLTYVHHVKNNGPTPQEGEEASFHVDIRNEKEVVQSSRSIGKPTSMLIPPPNQQGGSISPIVEGIQLMSVGDSLTVLNSIDSFKVKPPGFENSPFIYFDIVLTSIKSKEEIDKERAQQAIKMKADQAREAEVAATTKSMLDKYNAKTLGEKLLSTGSGLKYTVLEEGTGPQAEVGKLVNVHYYGMTTDGNMFDNSFKGGSAYGVPVGRGQVIRGWDEGIPLFKEGAKAVLFIPYDLAYGEAGRPPTIPPRAELVFYIEIEKVN